MTSSIQLLLVAVIITLTIFLIIIGIQVMTILIEIQQILRRGGTLPEQVRKPLFEIKESISSPRRFFKKSGTPLI
jgi:hypothetical protein